MAANVHRPEPQHDVVFRDAGRHQFFGNPLFGAIALDPDLPSDDVHMHQTAVNPFAAVPPDIHEQVTIALAVKDRFGLDLSEGVGNSRVFRQNAFDRPAGRA